MLQPSKVLFAVMILFVSQPVFAKGKKDIEYENLSVSYMRSTTVYNDSLTPDTEADFTKVSYLASEKDWTTTINFIYLPEQNTQENDALTVNQTSWTASIDVLRKIELGNGFYIGPKAQYAYTETEGDIYAAGSNIDLQDHSDTLTGIATIGYKINDKSDFAVNYTFRDDFLTGNEDNERPISADLLYTLSNNYSLHFSVSTVTEKPDETKETYNVSFGFGSTF